MRRLIILSALLLSLTSAQAVLKPTTLYVFGFAFSFNDSTVFITDLMTLDSAWLETHSQALYERQNYSYQLKEYLQRSQNFPNATCAIIYSQNQKKAEKKYLKMRQRYTKKLTGYVVHYVPATDFQFSAISAADDYNAIQAATDESRKAAKKAAREQRRREKQAMLNSRSRGRGPRGNSSIAPPEYDASGMPAH